METRTSLRAVGIDAVSFNKRLVHESKEQITPPLQGKPKPVQVAVIAQSTSSSTCVFMYSALCVSYFVTKRRNSWACRGNPNPEQETIKGTHCVCSVATKSVHHLSVACYTSDIGAH